MSKKGFKAAASSGRAISGFGGFGTSTGSSTLSYIQEPLDLQAISDPASVVLFKNLSKRDETTKAKALDDLLASLDQASSPADDGILEAWVRLYPRLSIDNNRRVRQLTHNVNGKICLSAGKRTAKHMPRVAGPWLAALHDNDRSVARTASEALTTVFTDPVKVGAVRKVYYQSVLDYCKHAILHETISTLSDERAVSKDDAENTYSRVISSTLALLSSIVADSDTEQLDKHTDTFAELVGTQVLDLAVSADAAIRRSAHRFIRIAAIKLEGLVAQQLPSVSDSYVYKGLRSEQLGSSLDFLTTLVILTQHYPTIWTDEYKGKKPPPSRLSHFLKQGSQGAPIEFWTQLTLLYEGLPANVLPTTAEEASDMLQAARKGLSRKEERFQALQAWDTYAALATKLAQPLPNDVQNVVLGQNILPLIRQYLLQDVDAEWAISGAKPATIVSRLASIPSFAPVLAGSLAEYADAIIELAKLSQPEQAKDHDKSQAQVAACGERWSALQRELGTIQAADFVAQDRRIIVEMLQLCSMRNGKPYGAAAIVDSLLRDCSPQLLPTDEIKQILHDFVDEKLPGLLFSPSSRYVMRCLTSLQQQSDFSTLFDRTLQAILTSDQDLTTRAHLILTLFSHNHSQALTQSALKDDRLQQLIIDACKSTTTTNASFDDRLLSKLLDTGIVAHRTQTNCIRQLVTSLEVHDDTLYALRRLDVLTTTHKSVLIDYDADPAAAGSYLVPSLLKVTDHENDEISNLAAAVSSKLSITSGGTSEQKRLVVVRHALQDVSSNSTDIEMLVDLAKNLLGNESTSESFISCLPDIADYLTSLNSSLKPLPTSMSICSQFGSALYLMTSPTSSTSLHYDVDGFYEVLRTALFFMRLLSTTNLNQIVASDLGEEADSLRSMLVLALSTLIAAEDKVSIASANDLWQDSTAEQTFLLLHADITAHLSSFTASLDSGSVGKLLGASSSLQDDKLTALSYYLNQTTLRLSQMHQTQTRASPKDFSAKGLVNGILESPFTTITDMVLTLGFIEQAAALKTCNELVATLTGLVFSTKPDVVQANLMALNTILYIEDGYIDHIPKQRLIFLVKHLLKELPQTESRVIGEEVLRSLSYLLPAIPDIYGEHWKTTLDIILETWTAMIGQVREQDHVPTLYHSLRLYAAINKLSNQEDVNDDLVEAIKERETKIGSCLLSLLQDARSTSDDADQPLMITNELLTRQLTSLKVKPTVNVAELLSILYAPSRSVQGAAFSLLHEVIPKSQEQVSLDAALDSKVAYLPEELLSMLLETPSTQDYDDDAFARAVPTELQSYLYSWRLLFDFFDGSSYKVKTDYSEQLKDGAYLSKLLTFSFEFLGLTKNKLVDVSGYDLAHYQADLESDPRKNVRWLLGNLYYLALLHLPSLVKNHVLEIRSRHIPALIEEWTAKHISPLIVSASLAAVSEWSEKTVKEDPEYEKMSVKVGLRSKEVNVSYIVDEQTMAIKIVLPEAYPLAPALVEGVSRVAVKEEKWQSWLRNCQGVITFSNGSITDGLAAWRRNVVGALKGQTECAICYSIISADKQLPSKKCPTCKNLFHSSCLFKWFKTSNASTCPLCRNPFNFN